LAIAQTISAPHKQQVRAQRRTWASGAAVTS
jgi:hypothetical protein